MCILEVFAILRKFFFPCKIFSLQGIQDACDPPAYDLAYVANHKLNSSAAMSFLGKSAFEPRSVVPAWYNMAYVYTWYKLTFEAHLVDVLRVNR